MILGIDARYAFRPTRRGIGNYIYQLLLQFAEMTQIREVVLYLDAASMDPDPQLFPRSRFRVSRLPAFTLTDWEQLALPMAAHRDKVDLLHCPSNVAPLLSPCPVVVTVHDVIEFRRTPAELARLSIRHRLSRLYRMGILPLIARRAALVLTDSHHSKRDIIETLGIVADKVRTIYLAPDPVYEPVSSERVDAVLRRLGLKQPYVLALAALDPRKNTEALLEAYAAFREMGGPPARLVLVGMENPAALPWPVGSSPDRWADSVTCLGYVSQEELNALYAGAGCFVYPSIYEGFGLPPLEAMACGTAVICSATTAVGEVVGDAALTVHPQDAPEIARCMYQVMHNPDVNAHLRMRGRKHIASFSWRATAEETLSSYVHALEGVSRA